MELKRRLDDNTRTYEYTFIKDNLELKIFYGGNLDLSWQIIDKSVNEDNMFDYENKPLVFTFGKDNMEVYFAFLKLYSDIINKRFESEEEQKQDEFGFLQEDLSYIKVDMNKEIDHTYDLLVNDGVISWHSDATYFEVANIVTLESGDEEIKLTFIKQVEDEYTFPGEISIRFRNSGSTYDPFNRIFMKHFNALEEIDPGYHQIHMGEYTRNLK